MFFSPFSYLDHVAILSKGITQSRTLPQHQYFFQDKPFPHSEVKFYYTKKWEET